MAEDTITLPYEPMGSHRHLICWKSIIAGLLISIMAFMLINALGAGILGRVAQHAVNAESGGNSLMTWTGVWLGLSTAVALFCGTYFTMRINRFMTNKVGLAHGFVIASLFFILMVVEAGSAIGSLSTSVGSLINNVSQGSVSVASSPAVQDAIDSSLGTTKTKADPKEVAQGLAARLITGDVNSAKNYYAYQTGLSRADVDQRIDNLKAKFDQAAQTAGDKAAAGLADAGWTLLMTFVVGLLASAIGGVVGAESNLGRPLAQPEAGVRQFTTVLQV